MSKEKEFMELLTSDEIANELAEAMLNGLDTSILCDQLINNLWDEMKNEKEV